MDRGELHKLIEEVTAQVGERLARRDGGRRRDKAHVVLLPAPAAFPDKLKSCLERRYPGGWTLADFTGAAPEALPPEQLTRERLLPLAAQAETVSLAAPPVSLLREIAAGEDASDLAYLVIRSILWGKRVELLLDFAPAPFPPQQPFGPGGGGGGYPLLHGCGGGVLCRPPGAGAGDPGDGRGGPRRGKAAGGGGLVRNGRHHHPLGPGRSAGAGAGDPVRGTEGGMSRCSWHG